MDSCFIVAGLWNCRPGDLRVALHSCTFARNVERLTSSRRTLSLRLGNDCRTMFGIFPLLMFWICAGACVPLLISSGIPSCLEHRRCSLNATAEHEREFREVIENRWLKHKRRKLSAKVYVQRVQRIEWLSAR